MPSSTPRLSEVARHVVVPSGVVRTGYPAVAAKLTELGIVLHLWQVGLAQIILGKRADGLYAASIGGVVISIPRQVGKTFLMGALVFALCLLNPGMTVLWTAHRMKTSGETFRSMQATARRKRIAPFIARVVRGSGDEAVEFTNGSRILFGAREQGFGRGFTEVDVIVFDEAQILTEAALDDMIPATNQSRMESGPLVLYTGTPPRPTDPGEVFSNRRAEALSGESDDLVFVEFSADEGCDPESWPAGHVDWDQVAKANPSFPSHTPRHAILRMFKNLGKASFRREGLGIWDDRSVAPSTISSTAWGALSGAPAHGPMAFGVKFSDGAAALAVAIQCDGFVHVEGIEERSLDEGYDWLVDYFTEPDAPGLEAAWQKASGIYVDGREAAGALQEALLRKRVRRVQVLDTQKAITAHTGFLSAVNTKTLSHFDQPALNAAVARAVKRDIGRAGGWGWTSIDGDPVTILEAATIAHYGATQARPLASTSASRSSGERRGFVG